MPTGYVVVDVDGTKGHEVLRQAGVALDDAPRARTGGGGAHVWFRTSIELRPKVALLPSVDLRGPGSYVVVPPSLHASGRRYNWEIPLDSIPDVPATLLTLVRQNTAESPPSAANGTEPPIAEGQRNATLASLAGVMRRRGTSLMAIEAALSEENCQRCTPPLTDHEVRAIARSIAEYPPQRVLATGDLWKFLTTADLAAAARGSDIDWVMLGILARRHVTLMPGLWKSGKTTYLTHAVKAVAEGRSYCNLDVEPGLVTIVSEEGTHLWNVRARAIGLGDSVDFLLRPFPKGRPTIAQWISFVEFVADHARSRALVIFDSIQNLWGVEQENDNAEQLRWLEPLHAITDAGAALLLAGHPSKAPQAEGKSTRGGGAIGGWVDIIIEFRRYDPEDPHNRMRVLTGFSRFEETPLEMVVELADGEYRAVGTRAEIKVSVRMGAILDMLSADPPGKSARELHEGWPQEKGPGRRTIETDLNALLKQGSIVRTGDGGSKADPYRFYKR